MTQQHLWREEPAAIACRRSVTDQQGGPGVTQDAREQFIRSVGVDEALCGARFQDGQVQCNDGGRVLRQAHRHDLIRLGNRVADDGRQLIGQLIQLCIRQ